MKFKPRSEQTRQLIIEKTARIFNEKGYAGTSLSDLTEATGLTKGSIYGNFPDKEDVALAAFDHNLACVRDIIKRKVDQYTTYKDKLLAHVQLYYSSEKTPFPEGGCPLQNTTAEADDTHSLLRKKAADGLMLWKKDLVTLINKGIAAREFRSGTSANKTALTLIALIEGAILLGRATQNIQNMDNVLDVAKETINGILTKQRS